MTTWKVKTLTGGDTFVLDDSLRLGRGGEGAIFRMPGNESRVIKIYLQVDQERIDKLKAMITDPPEDPMRNKGHASIAWPEDLVVSLDDGQVCGFVMPRLRDGYAVWKFFDVDFRKANFPAFTYRSLCRIASNLASAVWAIHEKGYVIGDVNDGNIMATAAALVTIVDTDSFQIREQGSGTVYRCPVGNVLYTPPEFQDVSFSKVDRAPEQDLFGVGVLLFQLLMEGHLPYACTFTNTGNPPDCIECLKRGYFPYAQSLSGITPPRWAPAYATLHPALQRLFKLCFIDGYQYPRSRPDAKTWRRALWESERALTICKVNPQHDYFNHCDACPWCKRIQELNSIQPGNWDPFPNVGPTSRPRSAPTGTSGTQRPISAPPPPPPPPPFPTVAPPSPPAVSPTATKPVPVALKEISVQLNAPMALSSAQLPLLQTLSLNQPNISLLAPMRLNDHVALNGYQPLHKISVDLNRSPLSSQHPITS